MKHADLVATMWSEEILEKRRFFRADSLHTYGLVYESMGDVDKAIEFDQRALDIYMSAGHDATGEILSHLIVCKKASLRSWVLIF